MIYRVLRVYYFSLFNNCCMLDANIYVIEIRLLKIVFFLKKCNIDNM